MGKGKIPIPLIIVFVVGLLLVLYPVVGNILNGVRNAWEISQYEGIAQDFGDDVYEEMFNEARDFNDTISGEPQVFDTESDVCQTYLEALDVMDSMMGYLIIDSLDVRLAIYHGTSDAVLQKGVGHLESTHLPSGDIGDSTVLTGHTGLPSADLLSSLDQMEIGDTFQVAILDKVFTYEVFEINVVEPYELDLVYPREDMNMVTLVTCTPYGVNTHRLLVHGMLVDSGEASSGVDYDQFQELVIAGLGCVAIVSAVIAAVVLVRSRRKKEEV